MKKKLVIHIGMGKTGTTALQMFFLNNRRKFRKYGICYPKYGLKGGAHHLLSPHRPAFIGDRWKFKQVDEWAPVLTKAPQETVLLSSELMAWADESSVSAFCAQAGEFFDVSIVIYLRRQDKVIAASYSQMIKAGTQKHKIEKIYKKQIPEFDYLDIIERWSGEIGQDKVTVRPYEQQQFFGNDIRLDFMHCVFGISACNDLKLSSKDFNPRLSLVASEYKRLLNSIIPNKRLNHRFNTLLFRYSREMEKADRAPPPGQGILDLSQCDEILGQHNRNNEIIARKYLNRSDGKLFLETVPNTNSGHWKQNISADDTARITRYLQKRSPLLMWMLSRKLRSSIDARPFLQKNAAKRLTESMHPRR